MSLVGPASCGLRPRAAPAASHLGHGGEALDGSGDAVLAVLGTAVQAQDPGMTADHLPAGDADLARHHEDDLQLRAGLELTIGVEEHAADADVLDVSPVFQGVTAHPQGGGDAHLVTA